MRDLVTEAPGDRLPGPEIARVGGIRGDDAGSSGGGGHAVHAARSTGDLGRRADVGGRPARSLLRGGSAAGSRAAGRRSGGRCTGSASAGSRLRDPAADRPRRQRNGLPRRAAAARVQPVGGPQDRRPRHRRDLAAKGRRRAANPRPARASRHRASLRCRRDTRRAALPRDGARGRAVDLRPLLGAKPLRERAGRALPRCSRGRRVRPPGGGRAPGSQARQHPRHRERSREAARLRYRQARRGPRRGGGDPHPGAGDDAGLRQPRADPRSARFGRLRRLLPRSRTLRAARRDSALQDRRGALRNLRRRRPGAGSRAPIGRNHPHGGDFDRGAPEPGARTAPPRAEGRPRRGGAAGTAQGTGGPLRLASDFCCLCSPLPLQTSSRATARYAPAAQRREPP